MSYILTRYNLHCGLGQWGGRDSSAGSRRPSLTFQVKLH